MLFRSEACIQPVPTTTSPASATAPTTVNTAPTTVNTAPTTTNTAPTTMDPAPTTMDLAPTTVHLAPTTPTATPTTRHPLPRYRGKQIDDTDLLDSIDRVGIKLAETLALVSMIQSQPNEQVTAPHIDLPDQLIPVVLHDLVQITWSYLLLRGAPLVAGQPS